MFARGFKHGRSACRGWKLVMTTFNFFTLYQTCIISLHLFAGMTANCLTVLFTSPFMFIISAVLLPVLCFVLICLGLIKHLPFLYFVLICLGLTRLLPGLYFVHIWINLTELLHVFCFIRLSHTELFPVLCFFFTELSLTMLLLVLCFVITKLSFTMLLPVLCLVSAGLGFTELLFILCFVITWLCLSLIVAYFAVLFCAWLLMLCFWFLSLITSVSLCPVILALLLSLPSLIASSSWSLWSPASLGWSSVLSPDSLGSLLSFFDFLSLPHDRSFCVFFATFRCKNNFLY